MIANVLVLAAAVAIVAGAIAYVIELWTFSDGHFYDDQDRDAYGAPYGGRDDLAGGR